MTRNNNFLRRFEGVLSIVDFMRVWNHYDAGRTGYLEGERFECFVRDLLEQTNMPADAESVRTYKAALADMFDIDSDERIGLGELIHVLPVEQNFFLRFEDERALTQEQVSAVFDHYDRDRTGTLEGEELLGLVHDLMKKDDPDKEVTPAALEEFVALVLRLVGAKDGRLSKQQLAKFFAS